MKLNCRVQLAIVIFTSIVLKRSEADFNSDSDFKMISNDDLMSSAAIFSDIGVTYFSQLLFDVTREQLVVGARDNIYRLKIDSLQTLQKSAWPAGNDKIASCLEKGQSEEDCRNYVKVLSSEGLRLFACGTNAFSPRCSWREIQNTDVVTDSADGKAKCPYNPYANISSLMTEQGVYFAGTPVDFIGTDSAIVKDFAGSFVRTDQFDSKWLNEPQFVGSFETDSYVFFFFRESAVEVMNCGKKIYSRIARVCKNDSGFHMMWTTFSKARLNCSLPGDYPFYYDEIQGISYLPDEGIVYATFNTPRNSIPGSAVCAFNSSAIAAAFDGPYKHQDTINSAWERRVSMYPKQCRNNDVRVIKDSSKYQLMDNAVQPVLQVPLYHSRLETIVHIAVDVIPTKSHREMHIMYVSTLDNHIKKISVLPRTMKTCVLEIWKPLSNSMDKILTMHFLQQTESLYIGTKHEVMRIPAQHCKRHKSRQACMDSMDPYCGWNELKDRCSPAPEKNPSTIYWHQNINSCPTFDHPIPGGWSEWSSWTPCRQANSNTAEIGDYCMCASRQCNNPPPENGGPFCEGVSIQVTNCTQHGEWGPWSEWSACSQSCGTAIKIRKRTCSNPSPAYGGRVCVGPDTQEIYCIGNPPCPEPNPPSSDGRWSPWSSWSECSAKCEGGYRFRTRKCDNPPQQSGGLDCQGCNIDYEICNEIPCPEVKRLSNWTPWQTLQNGTEKRLKFSCKAPVNDPLSIKIALSKEEERICQRDGSCYRSGRSDPEDSWSEWSPWSACSAPCDGGKMYRTRKCELRNEDCIGLTSETKFCNTHPCKGEWSCWTDWSSCSVTCGTGIKQRTRVCLSVVNRSHETDNCDGSSISQERCEMPPCPTKGWSQWSPWSECDDQNQQHRTRKCNLSYPDENTCLGLDRETKSCDDISNDISNALGVQSGQYGGEPPSTFTMIIFCVLAFVAGLGISSGFCYYRIKTHQRKLPSSPHYISKQNPYVTVPLRETHTPKRTPSFSKNTLTLNGAPKSLSKTATVSSNSADYETATIKRNSHNLLNGHARTSALEQERFF